MSKDPWVRWPDVRPFPGKKCGDRVVIGRLRPPLSDRVPKPKGG